MGGMGNYDKNVAKYVSQGYCNGQCQESLGKDQMKAMTELLCKTKDDGKFDCSGLKGYKDSWMSSGYLYKKRAPLYIMMDEAGKAASYPLSCPTGQTCDDVSSFFDDDGNAVATAANTLYKTCDKFKTGLCEKRLLKGGLMLKDWDLSDEAAGTTCTILTLASLCCCLFLIVYFLQTIVKGPAARILQKVIGFNGYVNILIGLVITILVQSSSITTSTLTPLCAVGLISLEEMFPLTLGANIGTTLTGIMARPSSPPTPSRRGRLRCATCSSTSLASSSGTRFLICATSPFRARRCSASSRASTERRSRSCTRSLSSSSSRQSAMALPRPRRATKHRNRAGGEGESMQGVVAQMLRICRVGMQARLCISPKHMLK